jgi:hypothetical protein
LRAINGAQRICPLRIAHRRTKLDLTERATTTKRMQRVRASSLLRRKSNETLLPKSVEQFSMAQNARRQSSARGEVLDEKLVNDRNRENLQQKASH